MWKDSQVSVYVVMTSLLNDHYITRTSQIWQNVFVLELKQLRKICLWIYCGFKDLIITCVWRVHDITHSILNTNARESLFKLSLLKILTSPTAPAIYAYPKPCSNNRFFTCVAQLLRPTSYNLNICVGIYMRSFVSLLPNILRSLSYMSQLMGFVHIYLRQSCLLCFVKTSHAFTQSYLYLFYSITLVITPNLWRIHQYRLNNGIK